MHLFNNFQFLGLLNSNIIWNVDSCMWKQGKPGHTYLDISHSSSLWLKEIYDGVHTFFICWNWFNFFIFEFVTNLLPNFQCLKWNKVKWKRYYFCEFDWSWLEIKRGKQSEEKYCVGIIVNPLLKRWWVIYV